MTSELSDVFFIYIKKMELLAQIASALVSELAV